MTTPTPAEADPPASPRRRVRTSPRRRVTRGFPFCGLVIVLAAAAFVAGVSDFAARVGDLRANAARADAIVALTGGPHRIAEAVLLLREGRADRLLISGVNTEVSPAKLAEATAVEAKLFACCVDLDYRARDTIGNAAEIARWARERGFRSLIVVTSSYHMPRTLNELTAAAPDLTLTPHPVATPGLVFERWWMDRDGVRLLAGEYLKYVASAVRLRLGFAGAAATTR